MNSIAQGRWHMRGFACNSPSRVLFGIQYEDTGENYIVLIPTTFYPYGAP